MVDEASASVRLLGQKENWGYLRNKRNTFFLLSGQERKIMSRQLAEIAGLQVPSHRRQLDLQAIQFLLHDDLTAQPASLGKTKGQVQHIVFVIFGLGHAVIIFLVGDDDMASRAGA